MFEKTSMNKKMMRLNLIFFWIITCCLCLHPLPDPFSGQTLHRLQKIDQDGNSIFVLTYFFGTMWNIAIYDKQNYLAVLVENMQEDRAEWEREKSYLIQRKICLIKSPSTCTIMYHLANLQLYSFFKCNVIKPKGIYRNWSKINLLAASTARTAQTSSLSGPTYYQQIKMIRMMILIRMLIKNHKCDVTKFRQMSEEAEIVAKARLVLEQWFWHFMPFWF